MKFSKAEARKRLRRYISAKDNLSAAMQVFQKADRELHEVLCAPLASARGDKPI